MLVQIKEMFWAICLSIPEEIVGLISGTKTSFKKMINFFSSDKRNTVAGKTLFTRNFTFFWWGSLQLSQVLLDSTCPYLEILGQMSVWGQQWRDETETREEWMLKVYWFGFDLCVLWDCRIFPKGCKTLRWNPGIRRLKLAPLSSSTTTQRGGERTLNTYPHSLATILHHLRSSDAHREKFPLSFHRYALHMFAADRCRKDGREIVFLVFLACSCPVLLQMENIYKEN